ncbi:MAG TPA: hypothetical protein VHO47_04380 [Candidatus Babeliales bacterium]|nr:hypothetical protein [Candidatus Babeliales bacterium]
MELILENFPELTFIKSHSNSISEVVFPENPPNQHCLIDLRKNLFYNFDLNTKNNDKLAKKTFWSRLHSKLPSQESDQFTLGLFSVGLAASGIHAIIPLAKLFLGIEHFEKRENKKAWHKPIPFLFPILSSYPFETAALSTFLLSWVAVLGAYELIAQRAKNSPTFNFVYFD